MDFSSWLSQRELHEGKRPKVQTPIDGDVWALAKATVRDRAEETNYLVLADKLEELGDPAAMIVRDGNKHMPSSWSPLFYPPGWVRGMPKPPSARTKDILRTKTEKIEIIRNLDALPDCRVALEIGFVHMEPPPPKKIWNHSRSCYRSFTMIVPLEQARQFLDLHKSVFKTRGHKYLDAYFGPRGQNPQNTANLSPPTASNSQSEPVVAPPGA